MRLLIRLIIGPSMMSCVDGVCTLGLVEFTRREFFGIRWFWDAESNKKGKKEENEYERFEI